jgi:integrase
MTKLKYLRVKKAKGKAYYYFDAGKRDDGQRDLRPLPDIKDPRFGDCYARARSERTRKKNKQGVLTLDGLIRLYEKSPEFKDLSESSKRSYTRYLARANQLMRSGSGESWPVKGIERKDVIALRDALHETPGAASQAVRALAALFTWAIDNDRAKENPAKGVRKFKSKPHDPWPDELLEAAMADPQVGMPVALLFFTGQRIGDAITMKWSDISDGAMRVYVHKKDKHINVAILPELVAMLDEQEKTAVTILTNSNGLPWGQSGLRQKLQDWAKERGHGVVPHGLRKNAVIALLEAGCTPHEVQGITDQSWEIINHYAEKVNRLKLGRSAVVKLEAHRKARNKAGK